MNKTETTKNNKKHNKTLDKIIDASIIRGDRKLIDIIGSYWEEIKNM